MSGGRTTAGPGGGGFGRRWWERMFAGVLILIALVAAVILFLVMARGYCECRTWGEWSAGLPCPEGCSPTSQLPADWNQDALLFCRKQLGSYGSPEVTDLPGTSVSQWPTVHERYFVYQSPNASEVYFFLAVQGTSYDPSTTVQGNAVKVDVMRTRFDQPYNTLPVSCMGPRVISEASTPSSYGSSSDRTWGFYCRISSPQGGFPGPGGFNGYRVYITNLSPAPLRYCYVAVCDRKYPKNDRCTDPAVALQITPRGYPGTGYPPGSGYPSTPPAYSPPYPPSSSYPTTPAPPASSPPPSSTGTGGK